MKKTAYLLLFIFLFATGSAYSQVKGFSPIQTEKLLQEDFTSRFNQQNIFDQGQMPIGDIIDPDYYYVGPNDILAVQNLTTTITTQYLTVTPENSVLIPRVGKVSLKGMVLTDAIKAITKAFKEKNEKAMIYVSLFKPRKVIVTLQGNVSTKGSFVLPASYRVSTALSVITQPKRDQVPPMIISYMSQKQIMQEYTDKQYTKSGMPEPVPYSRRNVFVLHNDGTSTVVDLEEAAVTGNLELDPYLRENDIITIPEEPVNYPEIAISGAVIRPVRVPYKRNDDASKLLKFAYGFTDDADLENITLNYENGESKKISVNDKLEVNDNIKIKPGASIIVPQKKNKAKKTCVVSVQGCVNKPGTYLLSGDDVRLYDVIDMVGGFTDEAYLPLAYILRVSKEFRDRQFTQWSIAENFQYSDLQLEDTTRYFLDVSYKKPVVSCDFEAAFIDSIPKANIVLHDGDVIVVPSNPKTVFVYGQVENPGYITFQPGKTMSWYIEQAGGYAINAEESRARIIDGRTKVWRKGDDIIVKAGDEIYVPKPPDIPPGIRVQTWAIIISAVTSAATLMSIIFTIVNSINRN